MSLVRCLCYLRLVKLLKVLAVQPVSDLEKAGDVLFILLQARVLLLREQRVQAPNDVLRVLNDKVRD